MKQLLKKSFVYLRLANTKIASKKQASKNNTVTFILCKFNKFLQKKSLKKYHVLTIWDKLKLCKVLKRSLKNTYKLCKIAVV